MRARDSVPWGGGWGDLEYLPPGPGESWGLLSASCFVSLGQMGRFLH